MSPVATFCQKCFQEWAGLVTHSREPFSRVSRPEWQGLGGQLQGDSRCKYWAGVQDSVSFVLAGGGQLLFILMNKGNESDIKRTLLKCMIQWYWTHTRVVQTQLTLECLLNHPRGRPAYASNFSDVSPLWSLGIRNLLCLHGLLMEQFHGISQPVALCVQFFHGV